MSLYKGQILIDRERWRVFYKIEKYMGKERIRILVIRIFSINTIDCSDVF